MRSLRPILIAAAAATLMSCDRPEAASPAASAPIATAGFIDATADIDRSNLTSLAAAFDADPVGVVDRLERDVGGRSALRRYAAAMIEQDQAERLGRQLAVVLSQDEVLARPEDQDGGVWYPHAEDAGFFTGGIGAVLTSHPDALVAFARGAGRPAPGAGEDLQTWLSAPVAGLPRPARAAFDSALRAAAYQQD